MFIKQNNIKTIENLKKKIFYEEFINKMKTIYFKTN